MKTQFFNWQRSVVVLCGFGLLAGGEIHAQQQSQRPTGAPGGGGGLNRNNAATSGNTGGAQYNANGAVGNATISIDPDTHNVTIIADEETTKYISEVITNLDRPQPQVLIKVVFVQVTHSDALDLGVEGGWMNGISASINNAGASSFGLSSLSSGTG